MFPTEQIYQVSKKTHAHCRFSQKPPSNVPVGIKVLGHILRLNVAWLRIRKEELLHEGFHEHFLGWLHFDETDLDYF